MSFLSSAFLWALPLAAIPVVIHLLNRRRREVVRWGAMQFLLDSAPRSRRIRRIDDWLLMLLRGLAIAAIVLALSRPQLRSGLLSGTAAGRDVILIVDSSLSTGRLKNEVPAFDAVRSRSLEIIESLDDADHVHVMIAASSAHWFFEHGDPSGTLPRQEIVRQLAEWKPTLATANIPSCVQSALLAEPSKNATNRLIVVVTDEMAHGWNAQADSWWKTLRHSAEHASIPTAINIVTIGAGNASFVNLSIEKLEMVRPRVAAGESFSVTAHMRNNGDQPFDGGTLNWTLDGESIGESEVVSLGPGQSVNVVFETACELAGAYEITCTTPFKDDLPADNTCSLVVESLERLPILVCRRAADLEHLGFQPDFLMAALGRGPQGAKSEKRFTVFDPTEITADELAESDLSLYGCVILDDVLPTSAEEIDSLADFVHRGGGLWMILGENVDAKQFNQLCYQRGEGLSPVPLGRRITAGNGENDGADLFGIHPPEGTHPATLLLGDTQRLDIDDVRIKQRWQFAGMDAAGQFSVLLETSDGEPLAAEHLLGNGRIIVQAVPCSTEWSNLSLCQSFVPLVQEWVWYLTQPSAVKHNVDAGTPIVAFGSEVERATQRNVLTPWGETVELSATKPATGGKVRYTGTLFPGTYRISLTFADGRESRIPFCVRREAGESRLDMLSSEQRVHVEESAGVKFTADPLTSLESQTVVIPYQPFWNSLLGLVVLIFVAEFVFSYVLTKNRFADRAQQAPVVVAKVRGGTGVTGRPRQAV